MKKEELDHLRSLGKDELVRKKQDTQLELMKLNRDLKQLKQKPKKNQSMRNTRRLIARINQLLEEKNV